MKRYELTAKDFLKSSIFATAFVTKPAIEVGLVYLSTGKTHKTKYHFAEEKGMVYSPVLIPNQIIPRKGEDGEDFEVFFTAETIEELREAYMKAGNPMKNWNSQHTDVKLEGVSVIDNWIIDDANMDRAIALGFEGLPKGTWMQGIKVDNQEVREKIKSGEYFGISIEGDFEHQIKLNSQSNDSVMSKILETVTNLAKELSGKKTKLGSHTIEGGAIIYFEGEELQEGQAVFSDEAMTIPLADGTIVLEGGRSINIVEGRLAAEMAAQSEFKEDLENVAAVATNAHEEVETLKKENEELKTQLAGIVTRLEAAENTSKENQTKLSKIKTPKSSLELGAEVTTELKGINKHFNQG